MRSFCKLINASGNCLTPVDAERFLLNSVHKDNIRLAAPPRVIRDSRTTDACTIYFDIWDSQKGSQMHTFVNRSINAGSLVCFFRWTSPKIGVPFCSHCSSWVHNLDYCQSIHVVCPISMGPHHESNHCAFAACCKGKPNHVPPVPPTTDGEPCPHPAYCLNCGKPHATNSHSCQFWQHRFDREWIISQLQLRGEGEISHFHARLLTGETSSRKKRTIRIEATADSSKTAPADVQMGGV